MFPLSLLLGCVRIGDIGAHVSGWMRGPLEMLQDKPTSYLVYGSLSSFHPSYPLFFRLLHDTRTAKNNGLLDMSMIFERVGL